MRDFWQCAKHHLLRFRFCLTVNLELRSVLTDKQDGEGDEEQEDMRHQVEGVHEAAVVQHAVVHAVAALVHVIAAKRQGHGHAA